MRSTLSREDRRGRDIHLTLTAGDFSLGGIGTATFAAIIVYQLLRIRTPSPEAAVAGS